MQLRTLAAPLCFLTLAVTPAAAQPDPLAARTKGVATAPVTVYEMSDFQCPYCKRHVDKTFPALEKEYIATGKVRWVFINYPLPSLHSNAIAAAEFAMCAARQGKFWPAHDLLYRHQSAWAPLKDPSPFFLGLADSLKLGKASATSCVQQRETRDEVKDDAEGAVKASSGNGTPTFYIEGGLLTGALPPEIWRPILDSVYLAKTRKKP
jgi:protein-disulfide isomerase